MLGRTWERRCDAKWSRPKVPRVGRAENRKEVVLRTWFSVEIRALGAAFAEKFECWDVFSSGEEKWCSALPAMEVWAMQEGFFTENWNAQLAVERLLQMVNVMLWLELRRSWNWAGCHGWKSCRQMVDSGGHENWLVNRHRRWWSGSAGGIGFYVNEFCDLIEVELQMQRRAVTTSNGCVVDGQLNSGGVYPMCINGICWLLMFVMDGLYLNFQALEWKGSSKSRCYSRW